jgi:hypothetical protein
MKRNFTQLCGLMALALTSIPLTGQNEGKAVHAIQGVERYVPEQGAQLRAETPRDSAIRYNAAGEKMNKYVYSEDSSRGTYQWENNAWVFVDSDPREERWNWIINWQNWQAKVSYIILDDRWEFRIPHGQSGGYTFFTHPAYMKFHEAYDKNGNLISFEAIAEEYFLEEKYSIQYNTFNKPVSMELYYGETLGYKANWEYNAAGFATLFESYDDGEARAKEVNTYDAKGNLISIEYYKGNPTNNWVLGARTNYKWDDRNRIISEEYISYIDNDVGYRADYERDDKGMEKKLSEYLWSANEWILDRYYVCYYAGDGNSSGITPMPAPAVYISGSVLTIQSNRTEQITIYSVNGARLYESRIQAGAITINTTPFPQGVLIVRGSSGWVKKVVNP